MSLTFQVLGAPGKDNALMVRIDSGQAVERLLFDCGEGCLRGLTPGQVRAIDHVFFSHLHMDHVAGFDSFFRATYDRASRPNHIWGPPGAARIMQHRFRGYLWNLHREMAASWFVHDVGAGRVTTTRFELNEAFAKAHREGATDRAPVLAEGAGFTVGALAMEHRTPTLAYVVRERPRRNVDPARLAEMGLQPGPWLKRLADGPAGVGPETVDIGGRSFDIDALRRLLLVETPGDSVAYLTDFRMDERAMGRLLPLVGGCRTIVCESQYREADAALADQNCHMTSVRAARLAARAGAGELVLFHLSDRYREPEWRAMLREARGVFAATRFPTEWGLEA